MTHAGFVHLRVHTAFSLSEGACHVAPLAKACAAAGMPAVAMTDTGTLAGAMKFTEACGKAGIQPIVGTLLWLAHKPCNDSESGMSPVVLLAKDAAGYANLVKLLSIGHANTEDGRMPNVGVRDLVQRADGLILLTGGPEGPVDSALRLGDPAAAERRLSSLQKAFGDRLYLEIQRTPDPAEHEAELIALGDRLGVAPVATNQVFFLKREDHHAHDVLLCIAEGSYIAQEQRRTVSPERYLKTPDEMMAAFADLPDAIQNTVEIARRCAVAFKGAAPILPPYPDLADGETEAQALARQAEAGLEERFQELQTPDSDKPSYRERLTYETKVIADMGFPGYFLIVADFIQWAKNREIPVGPGRGSGAGSLVAYALKITDLDPLRYGLLFERFLNPDRVSMPDFDIDFCQERRDEVIDYVRARYGSEKVLQIGTFGSYKARAAFRNAARALQIPYPVADKWSKMIPNNPSDPKTLSQALEMEPLKDELPRAPEDIRNAFDVALGIEDLHSHASTHAAGVVIADRPVDELVPVMRDKEGAFATNFDMKAVEKAGLVKFDFLGLKTLDVIQGAQKMAAEGGQEIDFTRIGVSDPATYEMLQRADSFGVFQLESDGMRQAMRQIRPENIDDVVALVSLYRPGPMENIPAYAAVKAGEQEPSYLHPMMEPVLKNTFGIIIYQEQVMELARKLAGYSLGQADLLRRAMGKKIQAEMDQQRGVFVEGATANGIDQATAEAIFDLIARFASYGFNKSHAAAYAVIAFRTAYLKRHVPYEFFAASMNLDITKAEKLAEFVRECRRADLRIDAPDVNASQARFDVRRDKTGQACAVRYALSALRGVGTQAMDQLVQERTANGRFQSLDDLVQRTIPWLNRKAYEGLIKGGACDRFGKSRQAMLTALDQLIRSAQSEHKESQSGQGSLLDMMNLQTPDRVPDAPEMDRIALLTAEYEVLGFYLSGHPLDATADTLARAGAVTIARALSPEVTPGKDVRIGALITNLQARQTRKQTLMAVLTLSDPTGEYEAVVFPDDYERYRDTLKAGEAFVFRVGVGERDGMRQLSVRDVDPLVLDTAPDSGSGDRTPKTAVQAA